MSPGNFRTSLIAALVGGAVVAGVLALVVGLGGDEGRTTTVIRPGPLSAREEAGTARSGGLTARQIYKRDAPGVVNVRAQIVQQVESPFDLGPPQEGQSTGSGFVVDDDGHILTNAHVIEGASRVTVQFEDNKTTDAEVVGKDVSTDIALLKVKSDDVDLEPLALGDSKDVQVGDPTIAIGNPFGLDRTLTTGVVSALQREIIAPDGFRIQNVIQTDAAINPGNSGGPLLDAAGRVIGINSQIATGGGNGNVGIAFAVPINTAKKILPQLKESGGVQRAFLGITGTDINRSLEPLNLAADSGVLVQTVTPGSPAAKAGIKGGDTAATFDGSELRLGGDIIRKLDGKPVRSMNEVISRIASHKPGQTVRIEVLRDGRPKTVTAKLTKRPSSSPTQP